MWGLWLLWLLPIPFLTLIPLKVKCLHSSYWFTLLIGALAVGFYQVSPAKVWESAPLQTYPEPLIAFFACVQTVAPVEFCPAQHEHFSNITTPDRGHNHGGDRFSRFDCFCRNDNAFATLAYCLSTGYPDQVDAVLAMCNDKSNTSLTKRNYKSALEFYAKEARDVSFDEPPVLVDFPVKIHNGVVPLYKAAYDQFLGNYNRSIDYGWALIAFWVVVVLLAALGNWGKVLLPGVTRKFTGPVSRALRANITLPALSGRNRTQQVHFGKVFDYLPPSRAETLIVAAFSLLSVYLLCLNVEYTPDGPFFNSKWAAYSRYFAVRSGILATYMLPFSILFAGRNNLLQWFTRWEYSVYVMFHRWISRLMMVMLIIHSVGYGYRYLGMPFTDVRLYIRIGGIGTIAGLVILVQGLLVLRRKWYELFLIIHIALAAAFMISAVYHVKDINFLALYYFSGCLWISDRILRLQRLFVFGFPHAKVQLYEDMTLKFRVPKPRGFNAEGGGHCFLHILKWSCFWQSHPFTYTLIGNDIVFYVKVKDGVTSRLKDFLESHPSRSAHIRVAVEGSYGEATPAERYDTSVFVAGGNGIPGIYAEALQVANHQQRFKRVVLVWVVREYHSLLWFYEELAALKDSPIETHIYVTKPEAKLYSDPTDKSFLIENTYTHDHYYTLDSMENSVEQLKRELSHLTFFEGRPNIRKMVSMQTEESPGSTCFVTCGHPIMVDDLRHEVVDLVATSEKRVDFFEQLQVWA